ncbi:DUF2721 domain-containing protein [Microvirga mediterraneensis]|uniref:DUF2721 domain-containing protein n=1 Tax=Microvirga mediterraneensis TaxID=2754695 RepID=A0A838BT44_9HYPH|nr:DUF2721 domain-containing protein [Microvirga mediterraneensis]MBA1158219.1 DUF2721 domain-containing protein [Microvirga mediterraneensis]
MIELIPDAERLSKVFSEAAAPAFFLGAVAGFISILMSRLSDVMGRMRRGEPEAGDDRDYLLERARLLLSAIRLSLAGGLCTTLLLALAFLGALLQLPHIYGAAMLFLLATAFVGLSLLRFFQEVHVSLEELKRFRRE